MEGPIIYKSDYHAEVLNQISKYNNADIMKFSPPILMNLPWKNTTIR